MIASSKLRPSPVLREAPSTGSFFTLLVRERVKYYFADFVRKGGGGTPQIRNPLFAEKKIRKGGEGGTPQIRNLFFGPKSGVF